MTKHDMICAIHDAVYWFENFGYNGYGIACEDDHPDHEPIKEGLKDVLKVLQKESIREQSE